MHLFSTFVCVSQHFSSSVLSMLFHRFYSDALKKFSFMCFSLYICILPCMCCTNKRTRNLTFAWLCVLACTVQYTVRLLYTFMYIIVNGDFVEDLQFFLSMYIKVIHIFIYSILFDVYTVQHNYVRLTTLNMYIVQQCTYSFGSEFYDFYHSETLSFLLYSKSVSISILCDLINNSPGHRLIMTQQPFIIYFVELEKGGLGVLRKA